MKLYNTLPRLCAIGATLAMGLQLAGCNSPGGQGAPGNAEIKGNASSSGSGFKVALLTPGDVNDHGWNQLAYEGLQALKNDLKVDVTNQVTKNPADQAPALRDLAGQGYDIIICHGGEFQDTVNQLAPNYPNTKFVVDAGKLDKFDQANVAVIVPKLEEGVYLLGMCAGGMTKSNIIGELGGEKAKVIDSTFVAYEAGAKATNPKVKVLTNYVGNWEDQNKGKEQTKLLIAQGADMIFHNADQAGKGMFNAADEANNVYVFGSNRNQNDMSPTKCLGSAVINLQRAFEDLVKDVQSGKFKSENRESNLKNGGITVEWNAQLQGKIPISLMKKIQQAQQRIISGSLNIERKV